MFSSTSIVAKPVERKCKKQDIFAQYEEEGRGCEICGLAVMLFT
jgi:hypothetical protein